MIYTMNQLFQELERRRAAALQGGGEARIASQHKKGKLTARERVDLLLDEGSFEEIGMLVTHRSHEFGLENEVYPGDGVVTGSGTIMGRPVLVFSQDFTVFGGSLSEAHAEKICRLMDMALRLGVPVIGLNDSGGARIQEGVVSLAGYADIFYRNVQASGVVPQISAIMGPCAGGAVYSPAMTDIIFMVENSSYMFVTGPNVVKTVTHEEISSEDLGGASTHATRSGICHLSYPHELACLEGIRRQLYYLPQNCEEMAPVYPYVAPPNHPNELRPKLDQMIPSSPNQPYDMLELMDEILDPESRFELQPDYASNMITAFGLLGGRSIGVVANQPSSLAGVLDINASRKAARFVRLCDSFNVPLLVLVDVPGFLPGTDQEWNGIIVHGAKLLYAFSEASVPRITVITRKAYGGAYDVMNSKHIGADYNFAWPSAEIAVMGAKGAAEIIFKHEIQAAEDPAAKWDEKVASYTERFANPYQAAARGYIDEVILPSETRRKLMSAFSRIAHKAVRHPRKKHGNIPL